MRRGWKGYGGEARGRLPVEGGTGARGERAGEEGRWGEVEAGGGGGAGAAVCEDAGVTPVRGSLKGSKQETKAKIMVERNSRVSITR